MYPSTDLIRRHGCTVRPFLSAVFLYCTLLPPATAQEIEPPRPSDGWIAYGCHWDLRDTIFSVQGFIPTAKAYYAGKTFKSFTYEVRMAKLAEGGPIGLLFRYNEKRDEGYEIHLWPQGGFAVAKFVGPFKRDFASGPPSHFNKELNTWNTVQVVGTGQRFDVFINGFHVCTTSDPDHHEGKLGLLMPGDARQRARFQIITMTDQARR